VEKRITLPAVPGSANLARKFVVNAVGDQVEDPGVLAIMVSELVTNVVLHAKTDVMVEVDAGPPLRVGVQDGLAATETFREMIAQPRSQHDPTVPGGRGIALVHYWASRIGLDDDPGGGKVVWFEI
jgi:hypothetical protein